MKSLLTFTVSLAADGWRPPRRTATEGRCEHGLLLFPTVGRLGSAGSRPSGGSRSGTLARRFLAVVATPVRQVHFAVHAQDISIPSSVPSQKHV